MRCRMAWGLMLAETVEMAAVPEELAAVQVGTAGNRASAAIPTMVGGATTEWAVE